tara:strand:+ start:67 stop:684 length:618 start_codon:yes stop_codon:yes gene_type:complete
MNQKKLNQAIDFLSKDKLLKDLIDKYNKPIFIKNENYFNALVKSIIYQQISGKAAKSIYDRFQNLLQDKGYNPESVLALQDSQLREAGLSKQKVSYIKNIAEYFHTKTKNIDFALLSDREVRDELIQIKGIGQWTIDMFLMFTLSRTDIMPVSDLGIKKGFQKLFNLKDLPSTEVMLKKSEKWSPHRTVACMYLWKIVDGDDYIF